MKNYLDMERLATMVRAKRSGRGLREVSDEIGGISPSTLSRVENCKMPDMKTFLQLCDWLQIKPAELLKDSEPNDRISEGDTSESIAILLRSDKNLDPATANTLATIIKAAYKDLPRRNNTESENS